MDPGAPPSLQALPEWNPSSTPGPLLPGVFTSNSHQPFSARGSRKVSCPERPSMWIAISRHGLNNTCSSIP